MSDAGLVVVTGEALVDLVLNGDGKVVAYPGGGPYNVARAIGRLGQPVAYLGRISSDGFGARLRAGLEADGVRTDTVVDTAAPTTLALADIDEAGAASYGFYAAGTSAPGLTEEDAAAALPERIATFYAGTLGLVFEPMAETVEALVAALPGDTLVALDPNCRPCVIEHEERYRARLDRLLARADVVKASQDDLAWLAPGADAVAAARALLRSERAVALVTLGRDGALVVTHDDVRAIAAQPVAVVDTIGAGDAFMGAFLARWRELGLGRADLARTDDAVAAAEFACRVAAVTCSRPGADPPRLGEL